MIVDCDDGDVVALDTAGNKVEPDPSGVDKRRICCPGDLRPPHYHHWGTQTSFRASAEGNPVSDVGSC